MISGKNKFITFSYDDGVTQDKRLIEIFNKYNLKAILILTRNFWDSWDRWCEMVFVSIIQKITWKM